MAGQYKQRIEAEGSSQRRPWPKVPTVGPTWRFEVEYLVRRESKRLRDQMRAAGIEHRALLELGQKLDTQRVAGYVQTETLFYNCVAFHAENIAKQHAAELDASQQQVIYGFVKNIRASYPLSKRALTRHNDSPADWQEIVRRSVLTD